MMNDELLLKLWGKTKDKSDPNPKDYHPLLYHLIDVGVAAEALWPLLPERTRSRITRALGLQEELEACQAVVLLVALHDLGKASGFQAKVPGLWAKLEAAGLTITRVDETAHHAFVTTAVLPELLCTTDSCGIRVAHQPLASTLAHAIGAHHGTFPASEAFSAAVLGGDVWKRLREQLAQRLVQSLYPSKAPVLLDMEDLDDPGVGVILTGLTAVADWIGSNQRYFSLSKETDIDVYAARARTIAKQALLELGWAPQPIFANSLSFQEIIWAREEKAGIELRFTPRGVQEKVEALLAQVHEPFLLVVEAAMGEGKTEAALFAADRALTTGIAKGIAMGLPTQATGNAMFDRVAQFLQHRRHSANLDLQLLHGQAEFHEGFRELCNLAANSARGEDSPIVARSWFTKRKQALLAPFGVGTIDQSLMGVLQTKHWFVRLFGLAGKVVIFDEVHAYDAYMSTLLRRLIAWLSALDCSVILLSATLPRATRQELIDAFAPGRELPESPYPRVSFIPQKGLAQCQSVGLPEMPKLVSLESQPPDFAALAHKLLADLPQGGCGVVICNTVRNAQAAYTAFREALPTDWEVSLFHARTPLSWRKKREAEVLKTLGKPGGDGVQRPTKLVLIGTQVLEQSLDYDADWMASEYAPIDLLLQRMGRLWRHQREQRPVSTRRFVVLVSEPENPDNLPSFPVGSELIYDRYLLLRTYVALRGREQIGLPHEIEPLVQAVYDDPEPAGLSEEWCMQLEEAKERLHREKGDDKNKAEDVLIPIWRKKNGSGKVFSSIYQKPVLLRDDDDPQLHESLKATTRLGDPSVTLVCLRQRDDDRLEPYCGGTIGNTQDLLLSALSLSRPKGLFWELVKAEPPAGWADDAHLRYARAAYFDKNGTAQLGSYRLTLHEKTGLSIEKEEEG